jgi:hypothetical protein
VPIEVRRAIPLVLGEIPTLDSVQALLRIRESRDTALAFRVLRACNRIRSRDREIAFPADRVREEIEQDIRAHLTGLLLLRVCPESEPHSPEHFLTVVLAERRRLALDRIFRRLALIYPPRTMLAAYRGLISGRDERIGNAVEYLEAALSVEDREGILPLLDETRVEETIALAEKRYGLRVERFTEALGILLAGDDPWLTVCALYVVGRRRERALEEQIARNLKAEDPRVRETAGWARMALATG